MSETARYRSLTVPHCWDGDKPLFVVDVASQGDAVVPWALSFDLPQEEFSAYCGGAPAKGVIHLRGHGDQLPFDSNSVDVLYSSHLLEDYLNWMPVLKEWVRVIKPGGKLIVLIPEKGRWNEAVRRGQTPNCAHKHEGQVGELSSYARDLNLDIIEERLTNLFENDYTILFVGRKR